ncbi:MAG: 1-(5-phosphoribosyl)-5-[(5-phosphoribosylamino)methylideneamino]imidazole-4-carboxamide isomerase [Clostridiales bacterium]|jgi:phosphoribosylformimino-5-aminoimidazole carboxamide ribotide isomerase|nr:1-(5-phosphoribosyl)-5-[(5-phosphoribosylamino)methylideneamino]imidazole-4-carboxamide isomerase [Clostridiales bacterium]
MLLFPAIDILDNRAVRLTRGDRAAVKIYGGPVEFALKWEAAGAEYLHVVDLNGAFDGSDVNRGTVRDLIRAVKIPVQIGGGVRTLSDVEQRLSAGASRVILGTSVCADPNFAAAAVKNFGGRVIAGIDCRGGFVSVKGWQEDTRVAGLELGKRLYGAGITIAVFTDISRDGVLAGANGAASADMQAQTGLQIIASGGVSSERDIEDLKSRGLYGAILGKALYEGLIDLKQFIMHNAQCTIKG